MSTAESGGALARLGSGRALRGLTALLIVIVLASVAGFVYLTTLVNTEKEYIATTSDLQVLSQQIAKYALGASTGDEESFDRLGEASNRFESKLVGLEEGGVAKGIPALSVDLSNLRVRWNALRDKVKPILAARSAILKVGGVVASITDLMPPLQESTARVAQLLVDQKADPEQVFLASRQLMLSQRIVTNVTQVLSGGEKAAAAADLFASDAKLFGRVLQGMLVGDEEMGIRPIDSPEAQQYLQEDALLFSTVSDQAGSIIELAPEILPAQFAAQEVGGISDAANFEAETIAGKVEAGEARPHFFGLPVATWMILVLAGVALLLLLLLMAALLAESRRRENELRKREEEAALQNERNQRAILKLLDEMADLADGDLTVGATVTEDITGAIADSMNYAVQALRDLVTAINRTSAEVGGSAQASQATAMHLAEASEHQAEQIRSATAAVNAIAQSAERISVNSRESAEVAQKSVAIAGKGAETVNDAIEGMDRIREQIQETSKRVKRLGESSQQIGDIVELIEDIADQTNILALNAAMQAAMAGEAGRGFAVVADEVQRLAERSGNATKQIDALVKTIQTDTHEAVVAMEQSTSDVVAGASLAEDAGEALQEIQNVSNYIARLIQAISESAGAQAGEAVSISDTMGVVQEITIQNLEGTNQTTESIGNLAGLADELQKSVAGFRLPT